MAASASTPMRQVAARLEDDDQPPSGCPVLSPEELDELRRLSAKVDEYRVLGLLEDPADL